MSNTDRGWKFNRPDMFLRRCAVRRARQLGQPVDKDLTLYAIPKRCPILGLPLRSDPRGRHSGTPSVDQIIPGLGYVKGNTQVISWRANWIKRNATLDELIALGKFAAREKRRLKL